MVEDEELALRAAREEIGVVQRKLRAEIARRV
jgi:hypothetical protein